MSTVAEFLNLYVAPAGAALGGVILTGLSVWWKNRVEKNKPRAEVRIDEFKIITQSEHDFRVGLLSELGECRKENAILRIETFSQQRTIIDLTRQVATLELDKERWERSRKEKSENP